MNHMNSPVDENSFAHSNNLAATKSFHPPVYAIFMVFDKVVFKVTQALK